MAILSTQPTQGLGARAQELQDGSGQFPEVTADLDSQGPGLVPKG
jgi:hypothetical protein